MNETRRDYVPAIAIWELLTVLPVGCITASVVIFSLMAYSEEMHFGHGNPTQTLLAAGMILVLGLAYMALGLMGGIGLLLGDEWGRKLSLAHAAVSLVLIPIIGTFVGALSLRYLLRADVKQRFAPEPD
jgi:hypothetical protein